MQVHFDSGCVNEKKVEKLKKKQKYRLSLLSIYKQRCYVTADDLQDFLLPKSEHFFDRFRISKFSLV